MRDRRSLRSVRQPASAAVVTLLMVSATLFVPLQARAELTQQRMLLGIPHKLPSTHLYVTTPSATVVSYPLNKAGLPATKPDWQLQGGLQSPRAVSLDGAGYIYVSDAGPGQVRVYAPGASGNAMPVRTITVPSGGQTQSLAVDKAGDVFVTYGNLFTLLVYPAGAHDVGSSPATPVLAFEPGFLIFGLVVDSSGRLYVSPPEGSILVYDDLVGSTRVTPHLPDRVIAARGEEQGPFSPMAVEAATGDVYMQVVFNNLPQRWQANDWAARPAAGGPDRRSVSDFGYSPSGPDDSQAMAVNANYVMMTSYYPIDLLVYKNTTGRQSRPVEVLPPGYGIVLWP
jgi:hypothetical protein